LRCVLKSRSCLTRIPRANKGMGIRATPPPSKLKSFRAITNEDSELGVRCKIILD
jgi:hypothetical protein